MKRLVSFDMYGTLVDWRAGIGSLVARLGGARAVDLFFECDLKSVRSLRGYRPYSEIISSCLREALSASGRLWRGFYAEAASLAFAKSPPFPDTILGLRILKDLGLGVAVISNTERRLARITLSGLEDLVDHVVTAEDLGVYKPDPEAFRRAYKLLGTDSGEVVHVSSYPQYDLEACRSLGIDAVHLNRYGYEWEPQIRSLEELPEVLSRLDRGAVERG